MVQMNLSFTVFQLACFCTPARAPKWEALHHLMEYLEGNQSFKITYQQSKAILDLLFGYAYSDLGNNSSHQSTSGMLMLYNQSPLVWKSKSQMQKATALQRDC